MSKRKPEATSAKSRANSRDCRKALPIRDDKTRLKDLTRCLMALMVAIACAVVACAPENPDAQQGGNGHDSRYSLPDADFAWADYAMKDERWWLSDESRAYADDIVASPQDDGGWKKHVASEDEGPWAHSTLDNGATWSQIRYLAKEYSATGDERYRESCLRGIEYLLDIQYGNGGWPQIAGVDQAYHMCVTFNDQAMTEAMRLMRDVSSKSDEAAFTWVDEELAERAGASFDKALRLTLDLQVRIDGRLSIWCQQYDEETLLPAEARAYEPAALSTWESAEIVKFLQTLPEKSPEVVASIDAALAWFDDTKIVGLRFEEVGDDRLLVQGGPDDRLWARFYDLEDGTPIFGDRDGKTYRDVMEISKERRTGYDWYGTWPQECFEHE